MMPTRGNLASADEILDMAHGYSLLTTLLASPDVYQINAYKQASTWYATITLVPAKGVEAEQKSKVRLILRQPVTPVGPRRTVTAHGDSLLQAVKNLAADYDLLHPNIT
jgi:hypothetical protein